MRTHEPFTYTIITTNYTLRVVVINYKLNRRRLSCRDDHLIMLSVMSISYDLYYYVLVYYPMLKYYTNVMIILLENNSGVLDINIIQ